MGVVTVDIDGEPYAGITDIGMRMLSPRELFRAQGFDDSYIIDRGADGKAITKTRSGLKVRQQRLPADGESPGRRQLPAAWTSTLRKTGTSTWRQQNERRGSGGAQAAGSFL